MRVALVALVWCVGGGCASDYSPRTTEWDDSGSTAPVAVAEKPVEKKGLSAEEAAQQFPNARECQAAARTYYEKDAGKGLPLLRACVSRSDFTELSWLLKGPWTNDIKHSEPMQLLVARVIARRGGFVQADTKACRAAGILIYDVNTALKEKDPGKLVLVLGSVSNVKREKWGKGTSQVANIRESTWYDGDGVLDAPAHTGRTVFARVEKRDSRFMAENPLVIAMRFEDVRTIAMTDSDEGAEEPTVIGVSVEIFDAAPKLTR